ncbi:hypothetical protein PMZ80_005115 [Knufia obscura]|uniref:BTB domain-containing protein n=1 Tax=Knufia obscura TaxID=1635080 RepID=A0ABR0RPP6_9EURO|nr:hypothetical protein PMZ80_005115 [Knufia obscura]
MLDSVSSHQFRFAQLTFNVLIQIFFITRATPVSLPASSPIFIATRPAIVDSAQGLFTRDLSAERRRSAGINTSHRLQIRTTIDDIMADLNGNAVSGSNSDSTAISTSSAKSTAPLKPSEYVHSELITISVGAEKKKYYVYKDLLTAQSPWFAARIKQNWKRDPNEVNLEHHEPVAFDIVLNWMFNPNIDSEPSVPVGALLRKLGSAYKLAGELLMFSLQNALVDTSLINQRSRDRSPSFETIVMLWDMDLSTTELFRMALRACVRTVMLQSKQRSLNKVPGMTEVYARSDLLKLVFQTTYQYDRAQWPPPINEPLCIYHEHPDGRRCNTQAH